MNRIEKKDCVETLKGNLSEASLVVITQQKGLTVEESTDLRSKMRSASASFQVVKNSLTKIAIQGTDLEAIKDSLHGPVALAFSKDPVAAAKVVVQYAEKNPKISVVSGMLNGKILDARSIKDLATLPSLNELRAKLLGALVAPATKLALVIKEPGVQVARVVAARGGQ